MAKRIARRCWCCCVEFEVAGEVGETEVGDVVFDGILDDGTVAESLVECEESEEAKKLPGLAINTTPAKLRKPATCCCLLNVSPWISKLQA